MNIVFISGVILGLSGGMTWSLCLPYLHWTAGPSMIVIGGVLAGLSEWHKTKETS